MSRTRLIMSAIIAVAVWLFLNGGSVAADAPAQPRSTQLAGGWHLRTGVFPRREAEGNVDAKGDVTIQGGGHRGGTWVRGTVVEADRAHMTAAFVYKAFEGDFVLTARRVSFDRGKAHGNCGSGLAAIGDLKGWDTPVATNASDFGGKPVWYRMIRKGNRLGLYEGPDGQRWMASNSGALIAGTVYAGMYTEGWDEITKSQFDNVTVIEPPKFTYSTTWLGNEFEGGPRNTVNSSMIGLGVAPDGTCITVGINGEQENEMGRYRDGRTLNTRPSNHVGGTGNAVVLLPDGNGLVARRNRLIGFDWDKRNGTNGIVSRPIGSKGDDDAIRGVAVYKDEVFVSSRPESKIFVLDLKDLAPKRSFPFERPGPLAVDAKGVLWVVQEGWVSGHPYSYPYPQPFRILGLDAQSGKQTLAIDGVELPSALFADSHAPSGARLLVADNGLDQQVKIFDVGKTKPTFMGTLGAKGGVFYGTPGEMKPGKFNGLSGIGTDAKGNLYTTTSGYPYRVVIPHGMPNISQLKAFPPSAINVDEPEALWSLTCPGFNCMGASWDAKTGDVYIGGLARYGYDAKRPLGQEWQIAGITANLRDDSDGESLMRTFYAAPHLRWLDGERFLFLRERVYRLDRNGNLGQLVRIQNFDPQRLKDLKKNQEKGAADPFSLPALFGRFPGNPPKFLSGDDGEPIDWRFWEWVDGKGGPRDGRQQREEYFDLTGAVSAGRLEGSVAASYDSNHDMWIHGTAKREIHRRRYLGLANGVPQWSEKLDTFQVPPVLTAVFGLRYDPRRDIMDLAGQTIENPGGQHQLAEVIRFTTWSTKPTMGTRIVFMQRGVSIPWGGEGFWQIPHALDKVVGWDVAGDVLYATNRTGAIRSYDMLKGNLIEWMDAGPEVFAGSGFFDVPDTAIRSYEISEKDHLILRQSNWTIRILAHRWNPLACDGGRLPPAPDVLAQPRPREVELLWGGKTGIAGTVKGYYVYCSKTKDGEYEKVSSLVESASFRHEQTDNQPAWYRVSTVNLVGEGPMSAPVFAGSAATTAKRVVSTGRIDAAGFDLTTRGNWQGVYGSEAAYLVQDHVAAGDKEAPRRYFTAGHVIWPGMRRGTHVSPSNDLNRLQSVVAPGLRCANDESWWSSQFGPVKFLFNIADGQPRQITIAFSRNARFSIRDPDTGDLLHEEAVEWPDDSVKLGYVAFTVSGRFVMEMTGEPFRAVFIDPVK